MSNTLAIALTLGIDLNHKFSLKNVDPYDHYAACWLLCEFYPGIPADLPV